MNRGLVFFLGILAGVILTIGAAYIINKASSSTSGITMFDERGEMMDATSYTIIQTIDNNHGLAVANFFDLLNIVLVLGSKDSHYDGMEVTAGTNTRFYQVGTYQYLTKEGIWKTVPVITLMNKQ